MREYSLGGNNKGGHLPAHVTGKQSKRLVWSSLISLFSTIVFLSPVLGYEN